MNRWNIPGALKILVERSRQKAEEGYTEYHDRQHIPGTLTRAGICYALYAEFQLNHEQFMAPPSIIENLWPRDWDFKPSPIAVRNLVKAGALIAAEIDREQTGA